MKIAVIAVLLLLGLSIVQAQFRFGGEQIAFCKIILCSFAYE